MKTDLVTKPVILIVDDDPDLLILLQHRLQSEGFEVYVSPNGVSMMDIITHTPPKLILLDIHMDGLDGGTICQLIKTNPGTASLPVILFSANDNIQSIAIKCGADGYIQKPFEAGKFREALKRIPQLGLETS